MARSGSSEFQAAFEALPLPCSILARDMTIVSANAAFRRALGLTSVTLVAQPLLGCLQGLEPQVLQCLRDTLYTPLFDGRRASLKLPVGWPGPYPGPDGAPWRAVSAPLLTTAGDELSEHLLLCLVPPGYMALPEPGELIDGRLSPESLTRHVNSFYHLAAPMSGELELEKTESILVVCEDASARERLATILRSENYQVLEAADTATARHELRSDPPCLVFIDLERDAMALAEHAFAVAQDVEVLVVVAPGAARRPDLEAATLTRPYTTEQFLAQARHMLRNRTQRLLLRQATPRPASAMLQFGASHTDELPRRVLLVEDCAETREATCELLDILRHDVVSVASSEEALLRLAEDTCFDVMCTDVSLPGISGVALAAQVRRRLPRIGIIFASGHEHIQQEVQQLGAVLLLKPYSPDALEAAIRTVCRY